MTGEPVGLMTACRKQMLLLLVNRPDSMTEAAWVNGVLAQSWALPVFLTFFPQ